LFFEEHGCFLGNLSPCSYGHMVGPREFFLSPKEKGLKLSQEATLSLGKKPTSCFKEQPCHPPRKERGT